MTDTAQLRAALATVAVWCKGITKTNPVVEVIIEAAKEHLAFEEFFEILRRDALRDAMPDGSQ